MPAYPPAANNRRNAITNALMNIQQPPPRQQMPQPQQPRPAQMASAGPPPPAALPPAPAMTNAINSMAQGPAPGSPRVPLSQVPQQMMQNVQQAPQRISNLFSQGASPAAVAPVQPDPLQQPIY